jgi:hypothetical protein
MRERNSRNRRHTFSTELIPECQIQKRDAFSTEIVFFLVTEYYLCEECVLEVPFRSENVLAAIPICTIDKSDFLCF